MKNSKNKRTNILIAILLGLAVVAYRTMFMSPNNDLSVDDGTTVNAMIEKTIQEIESIKFDTSIVEDPKFKSLKSIEIPLPSLPVGKKNPFSDTYDLD